MRALPAFPISSSTWRTTCLVPPAFRVRDLVCVADRSFHKGEEIFDSLVKIPLESDIAEDLLRYFRVRKMWDEKRYAEVSDAELIFRNEARNRFKGRTFEGFYRNWKNGQVSAGAIQEKFGRNDRRRRISFGVYQLGQMEVSGLDSAKSGAESKTCVLQTRD